MGQEIATGTPDSAKIVTSDIARFWRIVDGTPAERLAARLDAEYIREGSEGVRAFLEHRIVSAEALANQVVGFRSRYEAARSSSQRILAMEAPIRAGTTP